MVYFVGAGPGATDLITVRGARLLEQADVVVYAGSLVNPALLDSVKAEAEVHNSARMTLEEIVAVMREAQARGKMCVRLHTGDPSLYGAHREQMDALDTAGIAYEVVPGVSSFTAAAAALQAEYTVPGVSQSLVITRMEGRTPVPDAERLRNLASHGCSMVLFLSTGLLDGAVEELLAGGYAPETPAAIVYKVSWPDEQVFRCTVGTLAQTARDAGVTNTALILVGGFLEGDHERSKLYDPAFSHAFRAGTDG